MSCQMMRLGSEKSPRVSEFFEVSLAAQGKPRNQKFFSFLEWIWSTLPDLQFPKYIELPPAYQEKIMFKIPHITILKPSWRFIMTPVLVRSNHCILLYYVHFSHFCVFQIHVDFL